jgi:uncharacterized protein (DUF4213/DUF364 family)
MKLLDELLATLPDGNVFEVCIGLHWTAVVVEVDGRWRCGLASTLVSEHKHGVADVPQAGELETLGAHELAGFARSERSTLTSVGFATSNALMPPQPQSWVDANASMVIARHGADKTVALIGHFPFIPDLRSLVGKLYVLEQDPGENELPAEAAVDILPQADVVAITSMTLLNSTFQDLLALCSPEALVMLLGPSTPLSPILFDHGIDLLSGSVVTAIEPVLRAIKQGGNFRQVHRAGVRLVTMWRPGLAE